MICHPHREVIICHALIDEHIKSTIFDLLVSCRHSFHQRVFTSNYYAILFSFRRVFLYTYIYTSIFSRLLLLPAFDHLMITLISSKCLIILDTTFENLAIIAFCYTINWFLLSENHYHNSLELFILNFLHSKKEIQPFYEHNLNSYL